MDLVAVRAVVYQGLARTEALIFLPWGRGLFVVGVYAPTSSFERNSILFRHDLEN